MFREGLKSRCKRRLAEWEVFPALWFTTSAALFFGFMHGILDEQAVPPVTFGAAWLLMVMLFAGHLGKQLWQGTAGSGVLWRGPLILLAAFPAGHLLWSWMFSVYWLLDGQWSRAGVNFIWALPLALTTSIRIALSALILLTPLGIVSGWLLVQVAKRRDYWETLERNKDQSL